MTTQTTLKIRFSEIASDNLDSGYYETTEEFRAAAGRWANSLIGKRTYVTTTSRPRQGETYHLNAQPGRTNLSHEARIKGWLGTTDNIYRSALGYFEVIGHSSSHLHLRETDVAECEDENAA